MKYCSMVDTKVLKLINRFGIFPQEWKSREDVDQGAIEEVQEKILSQLAPEDIAEHNRFAYSNSVAEYDSKPANSLVVPELPMFMNLMPNDSLVLDLGAGHLRDTQYMINPEAREFLNREGMTYSDLEKKLRVIPLEVSSNFLDSCYHKISDKIEKVPLIVTGSFLSPGKGISYHSKDKSLEDIFTNNELRESVDGIWSCAAYMVHMAPGKLEETTREWTKTLKSGGIFAVSYINKKEGNGEMKLLASRSAPGEIKIFSHYTSEEVDKAFSNSGLKLINSTTGDYDGHGHVMNNFFGSAMYRKE